MTISRSLPFSAPLLRPVSLALLGLMTGGAALAEQSPYYVGGALGVTHVSNIYRTSSATPRNNDNVTTATLLAGLDQRFGRQRLFGDVSLRNNRYAKNKSLGNDSYALNAGLDWETVNRLSGQLSLSSNRNLAQFNPGAGAPEITKKNIEQTDQLRASVRYGLASLLSLEGSLTHRRREYSAREYDAYDFKQDTASLGLSYRPREALTLGIAARYSEGSYPHVPAAGGTSVKNDFTGKDLDFTAGWILSGASALNARLSASRRDYKLEGARDFSGLTGSLSWRWQPTAKLQINSSLTRDTGDETSFLNLGSLGGVTSDYSRVTNSLQVNSSYELTGKVMLDAGLSYGRRSQNNRLGNLDANGSERTTSLSLGARWMVTRSGLIGCQINHDKRDADAFISTPYSANSYGCYGQLTLR